MDLTKYYIHTMITEKTTTKKSLNVLFFAIFHFLDLYFYLKLVFTLCLQFMTIRPIEMIRNNYLNTLFH